jgi:hypothetical protein
MGRSIRVTDLYRGGSSGSFDVKCRCASPDPAWRPGIGGRIYDAHIAEIARLGGARTVITGNTRHFKGLAAQGITVLTAAAEVVSREKWFWGGGRQADTASIGYRLGRLQNRAITWPDPQVLFCPLAVGIFEMAT